MTIDEVKNLPLMVFNFVQFSVKLKIEILLAKLSNFFIINGPSCFPEGARETNSFLTTLLFPNLHGTDPTINKTFTEM